MNQQFWKQIFIIIIFTILEQPSMKIISILCSILTLINGLLLTHLRQNQNLPTEQQKKDNSKILGLFENIDKQDDEKLNQQEIKCFLKEMGIQQQNASDTLLQDYDVDQDGYVGYAQFEVRSQYFENMKNLFNGYDQDKDSKLSPGQILVKISPKAQVQLHKFDTDQDKMISYKQFRNWLGFQ